MTKQYAKSYYEYKMLIHAVIVQVYVTALQENKPLFVDGKLNTPTSG